MVEASGTIPEQHLAMTPITEQEAELGVEPDEGSQLKGSAAEASRRKEGELLIRLIEALTDLLDRFTAIGVLSWRGIVRPEQQAEVDRNTLRRWFKREDLGLTPLEQKPAVVSIEAAMPFADVSQQKRPLIQHPAIAPPKR